MGFGKYFNLFLLSIYNCHTKLPPPPQPPFILVYKAKLRTKNPFMLVHMHQLATLSMFIMLMDPLGSSAGRSDRLGPLPCFEQSTQMQFFLASQNPLSLPSSWHRGLHRSQMESLLG
jgi:hypothetical protein